MTERTTSQPPPIATTALFPYTTVAPSLSRDALQHSESVDEEPYTIKCICEYNDDDGATIYCETCDTWQHIECFYHGNSAEASRDDFNHFCAECKPRPLDSRKAKERQRLQRQEKSIHETGDKKKRPPSKSHKKKPKPSDVQINGYHPDQIDGYGHKNTSPHDSSHAKKTKSHRSHQSISSQAAKPSPSHPSRINSFGHPPSPATTPPDLPDDFMYHSYSKQLQDLYENDPGPQQLQTNSFAKLDIASTLSTWLRDPAKLKVDTGIENSSDAFQMVKIGFDFAGHRWPELSIQSKQIAANDGTLSLRYLTVVEPLGKKDNLVGELKGTIGFQREIVEEDPDTFVKLCHPPPFVFFHPDLPLYIDTRKEGSICRYIRRSCRANTTLDTYITNKTEYHFCIVNERPLSANEQITLAWDFQFKTEINQRYLRLLGLSEENNPVEPDVSESEYIELSELIHNLLSEYGGCACGLESDCAFARFHRNYFGKSHTQSNGMRSKKGNRKMKQHISPTSTGHATNSRDASEGHQELFDAEEDGRSTSGSVRSKPQSRDMTPVANGLDANGTTGQISERERRKLVEIEKRFEAEQAQPLKKKKRTSDGASTVNGTSNSPSSHQPSSKRQKSAPRSSISNNLGFHLNGNRQYRDAGTSRQHSGSPTSGLSPSGISPRSRGPSHAPSEPDRSGRQSVAPSNYVDTSTQTDEVADAWYPCSPSTKPKRSVMPLARRLLSSRHRLMTEMETFRLEKEQASSKMVITDAHMDMDLQTSEQSAASPVHSDSSYMVNGFCDTLQSRRPSAPLGDDDVPMLDAPPADEASVNSNTSPADEVKSGMAHMSSPTEMHAPDLKAHIPPRAIFTPTQPPFVPNGIVTPSSTVGQLTQTPYTSVQFHAPFSPSVVNAVAPSPIKKKLSLSDYKARMKKQPDHKGSLGSETAPPTTILEGKSVDEATVASPAVESRSDPLSLAGEATVTDAKSLHVTSNGVT